MVFTDVLLRTYHDDQIVVKKKNHCILIVYASRTVISINSHVSVYNVGPYECDFTIFLTVEMM